jgi:hypothetical protein
VYVCMCVCVCTYVYREKPLFPSHHKRKRRKLNRPGQVSLLLFLMLRWCMYLLYKHPFFPSLLCFHIISAVYSLMPSMQHNHTHIPTTNKNIDQMVGDDDSSVASSRESFHRSDLDSSSDDDPDTHAGHTTTLPPPTSQQVQD